MRILFVSTAFYIPNQGLYETTRLHYQALTSVFSANNVDVITFCKKETLSNVNNNGDRGLFTLLSPTRLQNLFILLSGKRPGFGKKIINEVIRIIRNNQYDCVWFNDGELGTIIRAVKKAIPQLPLIEYHTGVFAIDYLQQKINGPKFTFLTRLTIPLVLHDVKLGAAYADKQVFLNKRDEHEFFKRYGRKADFYLPVCYEDKATIKEVPKGDEFRILFVGGYVMPNILGITWFVNNVMPHIENGTLYIVGRNMENLKDEPGFARENIRIVGAVEDLSYWYNSADVVVGPIFHGTGMKTKTTEAMMYGKRFLGTYEALVGYEEEGLLIKCQTAQDFIERINEYIANGVPRFDPEIRKLYEENHSIETAKRIFRNIVESTVSQ